MRVDINDPKIVAAADACVPEIARTELDRARSFYWNPVLSQEERICCFVRVAMASLLHAARLAGLTRDEVIELLSRYQEPTP